jgi:hypothetical protein
VNQILTQAGEYVIYRGSEATRRRDEHEAEKWYFEPGDYVGFTIFSDAYETFDEATQAALECGEREETLKNEIGGGG